MLELVGFGNNFLHTIIFKAWIILMNIIVSCQPNECIFNCTYLKMNQHFLLKLVSALPGLDLFIIIFVREGFYA